MDASSDSADSSTPPRPAFRAVMTFFRHSVAGYLIAGGAALKLIVLGFVTAGVAPSESLQIVSSLGGLLLAAGAGILIVKGAHAARRRLLWRVRRKLIVSYLLIGLVPAVLLVIFFVLTGWLLFANLSSYLIRSSLADVAGRALFAAKSAVLELDVSAPPADVAAVLARVKASLETAYPGVSLLALPAGPEGCPAPAVDGRQGSGAPGTVRAGSPRTGLPLKAGDWDHLDPPLLVPAWVPCAGFAGALAYETGTPPGSSVPAAELVVRAVARAERSNGVAVIVDVPVSETVKRRIEESTGIAIGTTGVVSEAGAALRGRMQTARVATRVEAGSGLAAPIPSLALLDVFDWQTGKAQSAPVQIGMSVRGIYHRLSVTQASIGQRTFGDLLVLALMAVSTLFLIVEVGAAMAGMALARSITGSVHELFAGTERVRQGDFGHRIAVLAKDQLGELAESFNQMTESIEDLLRQAAEKKRLEEEMRLAREIQMSLLPRGPLEIPGMTVAAVCVPAREVGGDYYDVLRLPDGRVGVMIADVSGKGMSAALYMAELKGLMLSLSEIHASPRDLLVAANRLISEHLDSRSFITMTYAVIDPVTRTMTYARAGHTPMLYVPHGAAGSRRAQLLAPDGMVLGLRLDEGQRFTSLLVESTLRLAPGDRLVFFTDGISEAMNEQADCFGEPRLAQLIEEHAELSLEEVRERILRDIDAFVGGAPQHDDMTLILVDVGGGGEDVRHHG